MSFEQLQQAGKKFISNRYHQIFLLILVVALIFRLINFPIESIWPDSALHIWTGTHYFEMLPEVCRKGTFLSTGLIGLYSFLFKPFLAGKLMSLTYSMVGIAAIYFLGSELKDRELGLAAALILSFHYNYWFQSTRPLLDTPLTAAVTLTMLCLVKFDRTKELKWALALAVSSLLIVSTKVIGAIALPGIAAYFLIKYRLEVLDLLKQRPFQIGLAVFLIGYGAILALNVHQTGYLLGRDLGEATVGATGLKGRTKSPLAHIFRLPDYISWLGTLLLIPGLFFVGKEVVKDKKYGYLVLLPSLASFYLYFSWHPLKTPRYVLPAVPALILIAMRGVPRLKLSKYKFHFEVLIAGTVVAFLLFNQGQALIQNKANSYLGYQETGNFLRQNADDDDLVLAAIPRSIRLFSGLRDTNRGGPIRGIPDNKSKFESLIDTNRTVWLETDQWQWAQPDWLYPLNQQKLQNVMDYGFKPVKVVKKKLKGKGQPRPVIFILRKD